MIASLLLNIVGGKIVFLDYILSRASQNTTYELSVLSFYQVLILFVLVIAITVLNLKKILWNEGLYKFYNIFAFLSIFILLNLNQTELSTRFYVLFGCFCRILLSPFPKISR